MNLARAQPTQADAIDETIIKLAVLAVGGQGGGVLTNWIADLATRCRYDVQMTSVAGVAQRTGATIYYVEMAPKTGRSPVFALSPSQGDLDVLIAAELMEAGRAVLRGFVTPDRTTLIASTHRVLAVSEKEEPGDGRADSALVTDEITKAALRTICFDMEKIAAEAGTMISASLFGGLARSGALPFAPEEFEEVIKASGRGVYQSLAAFRGALNYEAVAPEEPARKAIKAKGPAKLMREWDALVTRAKTFPAPAQEMLMAGLKKTVDYQDIAYGTEYLDHVQTFADHDTVEAKKLTINAAKYVANAMCYDDLPRVADLKVRQSRDVRLRGEQQIKADEIAHVTEYFHPRAAEVCGTLPARLGAAIEARPKLFKLLDRLINKGRRIRTDTIRGFGMLWLVSMVRPYRRRLLRHRVETAHLTDLMRLSLDVLPDSYDMAVEVLACQRLIKGYSDTHARGHSKFGRVISMVPVLRTRDDGADWLARLREAGLQDEKGDALDGAIMTVKSFASS
ncbi:indolepyruvate oxidoreductase subunit beta family protein [Thalassococcus sp. S3]|uniref:indolepyruvate oxidoreductase subunit beta family protein n=1 Tax=Thalassococcus sp. S3 TaxID=2017482 RepID=UPI0010240A82|nr:indolepyruvate oxidoreductase subunit beta family protein [Thalassococcus sp. S3]QBF30503.1 indolepyruvate oxidoreductase subunit B [Thalassococcus sp. S3]